MQGRLGFSCCYPNGSHISVHSCIERAVSRREEELGFEQGIVAAPPYSRLFFVFEGRVLIGGFCVFLASHAIPYPFCQGRVFDLWISGFCAFPVSLLSSGSRVQNWWIFPWFLEQYA